MSQRGERQQYDPVFPTKCEQVPFGEVWMGFDLHDGGLDSRSRDDLLDFLQRNVRQTDRFAATVVYEALEGLPRLDQRHAPVVHHLPPLVPRVLFVAGLEGERGMDEVAVNIIEPESPETCVDGGFDPFGPMIGVP